MIGMWILGTCLALVVLLLLGTVALTHRRTGPSRGTCASCFHWDLEEGQAAMREHGDFVAAASVLAPHQMGTRVRYAEQPDGTLQRIEDKPDITRKAKWTEFGLCQCPCPSHDGSVIMYGGDKCDHWKRRPFALRARA